MDDGSFANYLFLVRQRNGLTQIELAKRSGLSARCISDLERGINRSPRISTVNKLSAGLGLDDGAHRDLLLAAANARVAVYRVPRMAAD